MLTILAFKKQTTIATDGKREREEKGKTLHEKCKTYDRLTFKTIKLHTLKHKRVMYASTI